MAHLFKRIVLLSTATLIGVPMFATVFAAGERTAGATTAQAPATSTHQFNTDYQKKPVQPPKTWTAGEFSANLGEKPLKYQSLMSDNTIELGFPYKGEQPVGLTLRADGDVTVAVLRGQIHCGDYRETIAVRFDGGKVQRFNCDRTADGSTNGVFLRNAKRFADQAKRAKKIEMEVPFFQNGRKLVEFNVDAPLLTATSTKKGSVK